MTALMSLLIMTVTQIIAVGRSMIDLTARLVLAIVGVVYSTWVEHVAEAL